jgi:hypothetical protein
MRVVGQQRSYQRIRWCLGCRWLAAVYINDCVCAALPPQKPPTPSSCVLAGHLVWPSLQQHFQTG